MQITQIQDWIVQCLASPPTQYRLYGRRFLQVKRPNQQYQSTISGLNWLQNVQLQSWHHVLLLKINIWKTDLYTQYIKNTRQPLTTNKWKQHINDASAHHGCLRYTPCLRKSSTSYFAEYFCTGLTDCKNFNGYRVRDNQRTQVYNQCFNF